MIAVSEVVSYPSVKLVHVDGDELAGFDDDERLTEYRHYLEAVHHRAWESFDRTLTALASGALAVSLAFVHDFAPRPVQMRTMITAAWCLFAVSLGTNLVSYVTMAKSAGVGIKQVDESLANPIEQRGPDPVYGGVWSDWTKRLNTVSALAFGIGVISLLTFALSNLSHV